MVITSFCLQRHVVVPIYSVNLHDEIEDGLEVIDVRWRDGTLTWELNRQMHKRWFKQWYRSDRERTILLALHRQWFRW